MNLMKSEEGMSLIEVIVGWMMIGFLLLFFGTTFIRYIKEFQLLENEIEVQYQATEVMGRLHQSILEIKAMTKIENEKIENILHQTGSHQMNKMIFDNHLMFEHQPTSQSFSYGIWPATNYANVLCANYIEKILIAPLPEESTFAECIGVKFTVYARKDKASFSITTELYFRLFDEGVVNDLEY